MGSCSAIEQEPYPLLVSSMPGTVNVSEMKERPVVFMNEPALHVFRHNENWVSSESAKGLLFTPVTVVLKDRRA